MIYKKIIYLCAVCFLMGAIQAHSQSSLDLKLKGHIDLQDEKQKVYESHFTRFGLLDNSIYFTSDNPPSVSGYNINSGIQRFYLNLEGRGPDEINNLTDLTVEQNENRVYILGFTGKIVGLDTSGKPVFEDYPKVPRAKEFIKIGDEFWIAQESPGTKTYLVRTKESTKVTKPVGPEQVFENIMFSAFKSSGTLNKINNQVYLTMPFGDKLYKISIDNYSVVDKIALDIPNFKQQSRTQKRNVYLNDPRQLKKFYTKNSTITGLYNLGNRFAVEVIHTHDNYRRALIIFDRDFDYLCSGPLSEEVENLEDPEIQFTDGNNLYFYSETTKSDSVNKRLSYFYPECD